MSDNNNPNNKKDFKFLMRPTPAMVSTSRFITVGQILSVISILLGGVILCSIALICALVGYSRANRYLSGAPKDELTQWQIIKASGKFAVVMSSIILVVNLIILFYVMPYALDILNTGTASSFWGGGAAFNPSGGSASVFW